MDMEITIKEIKTEKEAKEIEELAQQIWMEHYIPIIGAAQVEYMLDRYQRAEKILEDIGINGFLYYSAYVDDRIAGYCAIKPEDESIFLSKLYVSKEMRGKGIGKCFINKILDISKNSQFKEIWLTVNKQNTASIEAYIKMGFNICDELITDIGNGYVMDDYKMKREI